MQPVLRPVVFLLLFTAACLGAPEALPPGLSIDIRALPEKATVGDPIRFEVGVRLPPGASIRLQPPGESHGDFTILEFLGGPELPGEPRPAPGPGGAPAENRHRARIVAAAYRPGEAVLPPLQLVFRDSSGKETRMETPAVKVAIESVLTGDDRSLKDLKRQAEIEAPARWLPWLVGVLLALAAAAAAFVLWRRRRRPLPQIAQFQKDPIGSAEAELRELLGRGWLEEGMVRAFYIAFSEIVRRLIAAGIAIPTAERTTEEILGDARKSPDPPVSSRELAAMEKLLLQSDLVKFAKSLPSPEESRQAIEAAFDLAEAFRKRCAGAGQATGRPGEA